MKYIVRIIRNDGEKEDHYYTDSSRALAHMKQLVENDSGLYAKIQLIFIEDKEILVTEIA